LAPLLGPIPIAWSALGNNNNVGGDAVITENQLRHALERIIGYLDAKCHRSLGWFEGFKRELFCGTHGFLRQILKHGFGAFLFFHHQT
jgi:hypothetical protein